MSVVVDASSTLAVLFEERGSDVALAAMRRGLLSAVNLDEVLHKSVRHGLAGNAVEALLARLELTIVAFDAEQAAYSATLHAGLNPLGISFADRACLTLAKIRKLPILTADRDWAKLDLGIDIRLIR